MRLTEIEMKEFTKYQKYYNFEEYLVGKTVLITGCKGLVGSGIIKWILLSNKKSGVSTNIIASTRNPKAVPDYIESDDVIEFCKFGEEKEYCKNRKIDYIIHAASPTGNSYHAEHPVESLRVIVDETEELLEIACENPESSLIYLSSEEVYGLPDSEEPIDETYVGAVDSLNYRSCYPLGKRLENYCATIIFLNMG